MIWGYCRSDPETLTVRRGETCKPSASHLVRNRDGANQVQQLPLPPVIEDELLSLGREPLVMVEERHHVPLGHVGVPVAGLHAGQEAGQLALRGRRHFDLLSQF